MRFVQQPLVTPPPPLPACRHLGTCNSPSTSAAATSTNLSLLQEADYTQFPDLQMYPTIAIAAVPIFNLGSTVQLVLTVQTLAQIFSGEIEVWDDPRIVASNSKFGSWGIPANQSIEVVVRGDSSTSTAIFKAGLARFDPGFASAVGSGGSPDWKTRKVTKTDRASEGLRSYVANTLYSIGYCILGEAMTAKLPMAWLKKVPATSISAPLPFCPHISTHAHPDTAAETLMPLVVYGQMAPRGQSLRTLHNVLLCWAPCRGSSMPQRGADNLDETCVGMAQPYNMDISRLYDAIGLCIERIESLMPISEANLVR